MVPIPSICIAEHISVLTSINDSDHIAELNNTRPKHPFFFLKPPSSILPPGAGAVLRPKGVKLHYEVELALIMGKTLRDLDANDEKTALDSIAGASSLPAYIFSAQAYYVNQLP